MSMKDDAYFLSLEEKAFGSGNNVAALLVLEHFEAITVPDDTAEYRPSMKRIKSIADTIGLYEEDAMIVDKAAYLLIAGSGPLEEPDLSISILEYVQSIYRSKKEEYNDWIRQKRKAEKEELEKIAASEATSERKAISIIIIIAFFLAIIIIGFLVK